MSKKQTAGTAAEIKVTKTKNAVPLMFKMVQVSSTITKKTPRLEAS
jgi:hypothetical protein